MIDYVLENHLLKKDRPGERYARAVNVRSYTEQDLAEAIAGRNMGISKPEALAMLEAIAEIEKEWLAAGNAVNLKTVHLRPSIPGMFREGEYPKKAIIRATPSKEIVELAGKIRLRQVEPVSPILVDYVHDVKSDTVSEKITRGGTVKVAGHNLKIAGDAASVCIEFVSLENPEANYRIPAGDIIVNNPMKLIVVAPMMTAGEEVQLKITTQFSGGSKQVKTPRSYVFDRTLTVV